MSPELFVWRVFLALRDRHHLALGTSDLIALRNALRAGFGWGSPEELLSVCTHLWARNRADQEVIAACFTTLSRQHPVDTLPPPPERGAAMSVAPSPPPPAVARVEKTPSVEPIILTDFLRTGASLRPLSIDGIELPTRPLRTEPQFPVSPREAAQLWRRVRAMVRQGPGTELDVNATVEKRARTAIATPPVLRPPRKNAARALVLMDRQGSMIPYHPFVDMLRDALRTRAAMAHVAVFYFHDAPAEGADRATLKALPRRAFPTLDEVLHDLRPLDRGDVYARPDLTAPESLARVLDRYAQGAHVVIVTDAGAARGRYDVVRLLDSLSFAKALAERRSRSVWLNPVSPDRWRASTAGQLARHVPMFPIEREGLMRAVNVLRGVEPPLECPL